MRPEVAMQRVPQLTVVIALLVAVPGFLPAQGSPTDSTTVHGAVATLRSDLRNFVTAQEAHFADHGTYARSLRQLQHGYHTSPGVTLVLLTSSDSSHSEIAISDKVPGLVRSEEHTSELQSPCNLVCRLLLEKKRKTPSLSQQTSRSVRRPY